MPNLKWLESAKTTYSIGAIGLPFARELDNIVEALTRENRDRLIIDLRGKIGGG